ncbi:DNA mismatch repair protein MutS [Paracoccaceae bacterium]|nr:DNA mismatch repair protein MutS [Paracoccaceae bacterium]
MQSTPVIQQYIDIKSNHQDALLFFRMGDFYELFFKDAELASDALGIVLTKRGSHRGKDIPMCGVPYHSAEGYIKTLLDKDFKIAICEQLETPQEAKKRGYKAIVKRDVVRIITPGTKIEESFLDQKKDNILMSLFFFNETWSSCWIDISTGLFKSSKIDEQQILSFLDQISPSETIAYSNKKELKTLKIHNYLNITWLEEKNSFSRQDCMQFLEPFLDVSSLKDFCDSQLGSLSIIVQYLQKNKNFFIENFEVPEIVKISSIMTMDPSTRKNLEINTSVDGDKDLSLLGVIDQSASLMGARLLGRRINSPSTIESKILKWQGKVKEFYNDTDLTSRVRTLIHQYPDTERSLSRLIRLGPNPKDIFLIKKGIELFFQLKLETAKTEKNKISIGFEIEKKFYKLLKELDLSIRENPPSIIKEGNFIKEGYDKELDDIKTTEKTTAEELLLLQNKYILETGIKSLKLKYNSVLGYFFETPVSYKNHILQIEKFFHRQTTANTLRVKSLELDQIEKTNLMAKDRAIELEIKILADLHKKTLRICREISKMSRKISSLDVYSTLGYVGNLNHWCCPKVDNSNDFFVRDGRHSIVEKMIMRKSLNSFVPNNCTLGDDQHVWLITGPNMAGKSTFLRQNAHIVILAQIGSFVPAKEARVGIANKLFSRIGASDNIARGQSTFMIEMLETSNIINNADEKSFLILDEIGRGTSTFDGLAIAWATVERILNHNMSRTLFATHYHELTEIEKTNSRIKNVSCEIKEWENEIIYSYKVIEGKSNGSLGIKVAELAGFPRIVIENANTILSNLQESHNHKDKVKAEQNDLEKEKLQDLLKLKREINSIDLNSITPLEALNILHNIKSSCL